MRWAIAFIIALAAGIVISWLWVVFQHPELHEPIFTWAAAAFVGSLVISVSQALGDRP